MTPLDLFKEEAIMEESNNNYEIDSNSNLRERLLYYSELSRLYEEKRKEKEKRAERKED